MTIVPATVADIPSIRAVALATWPVVYGAILSTGQLAYMLDLMYSEAALHEQLTRKGHQALLLKRATDTVGFGSYEHRVHESAMTRLHKLYVLPTEQGIGGGGLLLGAVLKTAHDRGSAFVELNVNRFNPAKGFYERHGFRVVRDEVIAIGQGYVMDDHVMQRPLP